MLRNLRVPAAEGQFDLQFARETACWPPGVAPRLSRMLNNPRVSEAESQFDLRIARKIDVGLLGACCGAGRTFWRQFRNSEQFLLRSLKRRSAV